MSRGLLTRLFPPPQYLAPAAAGLDLSDRSLKFVSLIRRGSRLELGAYGEKVLPLDLIQSGEIKNPAALTETLRQARSDWRLNDVAVALPEEKAYVAEVAPPPNSDWRESLELQLEEYVPLKATEAIFDFEARRGVKSRRTAIVSVVPRQLVLDYEEVLTKAGFQVGALEIEAQAIARALIPTTDPSTVLIVDFGRTRTSFFIATRGQVLFTSTTNQLGGDLITRAIAKQLQLEADAAEDLKRKSGLLNNTEQASLTAALVPALSVLRDEILKLISFWQKQTNQPANQAVSRVILCGGEATIPGLLDYFSQQIPLPLELGNVWINVLDLEKNVPTLPQSDSLRYATAIGLALRAYHYD